MSTTGSNSIASILSVFVLVVHALAWAGLVVFGALNALGLLAVSGSGIPGLGFLADGDVSQQHYIIGLSVVIVFFVGLILITGTLRQILKTLVAGDPFVSENAPRLVHLAAVIAAMEIARYGIHFFGLMLGMEQGDGFVINVAAWTAVVALFVLSQVFREGTRLREEEKMTI